MRKIYAFIISICIIISCFSFMATFVQAYSVGDLNNDRKVNAADLNMMAQLITGQGTSTNLANKFGDINNDNKVNSADLNLVKKYFVGKYTFSGTEIRINEIKIDGTDITEFVIECPEDADDCLIYTAETLQSHLGNACGYYPEIVTDAKDSYAIKLMKDSTAIGDEAGVLKDEAYHMYSYDKGIVIEGGRYNGCMNGMYDFLQKYIGYVFYFDPEIFSTDEYQDYAQRYIYEADTISISNLDDTHYPSIQYRGIARWDDHARSPSIHCNALDYYRNDALRKRYGIYGIIEIANHGIQGNYLYTELEMREKGWGYLYDKQPCFTNEELINTVIERTLALLDKKVESGMVPGKDFAHIDVSQIDSINFCICRKCTAQLRIEKYQSGPVLQYTNRVEEAVQARDEYKGKVYVTMLAYLSTLRVPEVTRPNDYVMISFCFYYMDNFSNAICSRHTITDETCETNAMYKAEFEKWLSITPNVNVWYYPLQAYFLAGCAQYTFNAIKDMQYFASVGLNGIYLCGSTSRSDLSFVTFYVLQKIAWDADLTDDEITSMIKEAMWLMYGEGYEYVYRYLEIIEEAKDRSPGYKNTTHATYFGAAPMLKLSFPYIKEMAEEILSCYEKAKEMAENETRKNAVDRVFSHALYLVSGAVHTDWWLNGDEAHRTKYKEIIDYFVAHSKEYGCAIAQSLDMNNEVYVEPDFEFDYDVNPLEWMIEYIDPENHLKFGWDDDYNY